MFDTAAKNLPGGGGDKNAGKQDFPFPYFSRYGILASDGSLENLTKIVESLSDPLYERLLKHGGLENRWCRGGSTLKVAI